MKVEPKYKPQQRDAVHKLLAKLNDLAEIFLRCLERQQKTEER